MEEFVHGRPSTYNNHKCRCEACTAAWAEYIRERGYVRRYQQRKREERNAFRSIEDPPASVNTGTGGIGSPAGASGHGGAS